MTWLRRAGDDLPDLAMLSSTLEETSLFRSLKARGLISTGNFRGARNPMTLFASSPRSPAPKPGGTSHSASSAVLLPNRRPAPLSAGFELNCELLRSLFTAQMHRSVGLRNNSTRRIRL